MNALRLIDWALVQRRQGSVYGPDLPSSCASAQHVFTLRLQADVPQKTVKSQHHSGDMSDQLQPGHAV